jgi:hypothetical protein
MMDKKIKDTHIVISVGLLVIFTIANRDNFEHTTRNWLLYTAIAAGFVGFAIPPLAKIIHIVWFWIGDKMGFIVSKVVLGTLFIVVVIPFGLLSRLFRKDLMFMKGSKNSCYIERKHKYSSEDFENPW